MSDVIRVGPAVLGKQAPMSGYITLKAFCENKRLELELLELSADCECILNVYTQVDWSVTNGILKY